MGNTNKYINVTVI